LCIDSNINWLCTPHYSRKKDPSLPENTALPSTSITAIQLMYTIGH